MLLWVSKQYERGYCRTMGTAYKPQEEWFGDDGAIVRLETEVRKRGTWGDDRDPRFREYVAREHLDGGTPISQLQSGHNLSAAQIRKWVQLFKTGGRAALERESRKKK